MSQGQRTFKEPTKIDLAASAACTKSGAFALALSLVLLFLIPYWEQRPSELALADYVMFRALLSMDLDQLDQNPIWTCYKESHPEAETGGIRSLPEAIAYSPNGDAISNCVDAPKQPTNSKLNIRPPVQEGLKESTSHVRPIFNFAEEAIAQIPPAKSPNAPLPPTISVTITIQLPELDELALRTQKLNDSEFLNRASNYSNYYVFSIARWTQRKRMLAWHDQREHRCPTKSLDAPAQTGSSALGPDPEVLANCLSIQDWKELAAYEMPSVGSPDQIGGSIRRDIEIGVGALPHRVDEASYAGEALLIVTLLYFGAFFREGASTTNFPAAGTLFSAFSRTRLANGVFLGAIFLPPLSSLALAIISRDILLIGGCALICLSIWWVFAGFQADSYFSETIQFAWSRVRIYRKEKPRPKSEWPSDSDNLPISLEIDSPRTEESPERNESP